MHDDQYVLQSRISWTSVFAGVVSVLAISILLSLLGIALGFALLDPASNTDITNGSGTAVTIWTLFSLLLSLIIGGYITGRLAAKSGYIHGLLVWALSLLVAIGFSAMTINSAVKVTGSALSSITSAAGGIASNVTQGNSDSNNSIFENLISLPQIQNSDVKITDALQKTGIPELQPDFLASQADWAKRQIQMSAKDLVLNPNNSDQIIQKLSDTLKNRAQSIMNAVDKKQVSEALAKNSSLTPAEAEKVVNNYLSEQDKFFNQLEMNIEKAKIEYVQLKNEAKEQAAEASNIAAKAALWSFIGLLIGLLATMFAGQFAVNRLINNVKN